MTPDGDAMFSGGVERRIDQPAPTGVKQFGPTLFNVLLGLYQTLGLLVATGIGWFTMHIEPNGVQLMVCSLVVVLAAATGVNGYIKHPHPVPSLLYYLAFVALPIGGLLGNLVWYSPAEGARIVVALLLVIIVQTIQATIWLRAIDKATAYVLGAMQCTVIAMLIWGTTMVSTAPIHVVGILAFCFVAICIVREFVWAIMLPRTHNNAVDGAASVMLGFMNRPVRWILKGDRHLRTAH